MRSRPKQTSSAADLRSGMVGGIVRVVLRCRGSKPKQADDGGDVRVFFLRLSIAAACVAIGSSVLAQSVRSRDRTFEASETLAADLRRARLHAGQFYLLSNIEFSDLGYENQFFFPTTEQSGGLSLAVAAPQKLYFVPARKTIYSLTVTPE